MRRAIAALLVTAVAVVLLVNFKTRPPVLGAASSAKLRAATTTSPRTPARSSHARARRGRAQTTSRSATGAPVTTQYGVVQVRATTVAGSVTAVQTLVMSNDNPRSQEIDVQAEPLLHQEALQAHSAKIDLVSGATYTSEGYIQSLQSAIDATRRG
jgi:uncharacterized protein with FMN-binding domain